MKNESNPVIMSIVYENAPYLENTIDQFSGVLIPIRVYECDDPCCPFSIFCNKANHNIHVGPNHTRSST